MPWEIEIADHQQKAMKKSQKQSIQLQQLPINTSPMTQFTLNRWFLQLRSRRLNKEKRQQKNKKKNSQEEIPLLIEKPRLSKVKKI